MKKIPLRLTFPILFLILLEGCSSSKQNIPIDPNLEEKYKTALKSFNSEWQSIAAEFDTNEGLNGNGPALIKHFSTDTLNLKQIVVPNYLKNLAVSKQDILITNGTFEQGILTISISTIFGNQFITHIIKDKKISTSFREYYKYDKILKLSADDSLSNELNIPLSIKELSLSTDNFELGKLVYGHCQFETEPYFLKSLDLDGQLLQLKRSYDCYFRFVPQKR